MMAAVLYGTYMTDNGNRVISSATGTQTVPGVYNCNVCYDCTNQPNNCVNCGYAGAGDCGGHNLYQSANQAILASYNCGTYYNCNCQCVCNCG